MNTFAHDLKQARLSHDDLISEVLDDFALSFGKLADCYEGSNDKELARLADEFFRLANAWADMMAFDEILGPR